MIVINHRGQERSHSYEEKIIHNHTLYCYQMTKPLVDMLISSGSYTPIAMPNSTHPKNNIQLRWYMTFASTCCQEKENLKLGSFSYTLVLLFWGKTITDAEASSIMIIHHCKSSAVHIKIKSYTIYQSYAILSSND